MLQSATLVGFVLTDDYDKARAFYVDKLGAEFVSHDPFALVVRVGGNQIRIVRMTGFQPLQSTVLGWEVADIEGAVGWLRERGVTLERYPFAQGKDIWGAPGGARVAWFKDPAGNVLSVSQHA